MQKPIRFTLLAFGIILAVLFSPSDAFSQSEASLNSDSSDTTVVNAAPAEEVIADTLINSETAEYGTAPSSEAAAVKSYPSTAEYQKPVAGTRRPSLAIKTNLLYWLTTSPNGAIEFRLAPKWSLDISVGWNPWVWNDNTSLRHWVVMPEGRYWLCQTFEGHFFGLHALYGRYNMGNWELFKKKEIYDHTYKGWGAGVGVAYGYHFPLGKRWGLELEAGLGYVYLKYDKYRCQECADYEGNYKRHYFGPTKAAINLIYMIH